MKIVSTPIPDVLIVEPRVFSDQRGFFFESYNEKEWRRLTGLNTHFVQDNHSRSVKGVLRGLHYQIRRPQGKLVRVVVGEVFDVAVDLRKQSPTFGRWTGTVLSEENRRQLWIPEGFAHGFLVLSEVAEFLYKATDYYAPQWERCVRWDDPDLGIAWPLSGPPVLSEKDRKAPALRDADAFTDIS
ncbi:dTDP-4-dehydrorhamnose 3,5-epimerase [Desulfoglaeba alkanexedens]|jgi:dTDP-4-dehydrorhamnose 3,5-epimerase|uniref:dTDP-4-dehydrorhamnose 3,5-epimerase n=1 Tax=Desulfoglaeba alkanexedens ALDC TaxID=980445 RepID=A0A4V1ERC1_9BACT|nr:dTDP-4-dehydrorhamnose 3,5-epimerase [Desulfoglaeba alkanexedens]QCQ21121.1 dTDP-4-dehydrorhamnose 3,5-epimerase [Desulfoglaeba alkanexedens ALDC]